MNPAAESLVGREIVQTRALSVEPARAFAAWTEADHLARWWGPEGFTTTTHALEARPGGHWRFTMHGPDGRDYENHIEYLEVDAPHRLVYRHVGDEAVEPVRFHSTVTFTPLVPGTLLTLRMVFESPEDLAHVERTYGATRGAVETLARLDAWTASDEFGG